MKSLIITSFIDNLNICTPPRNRMISCIKSKLITAFEIVDMGPLAFYVGLKVTQDRKKQTIKLSQLSYIEKLSYYYSILKAKIAKVPMQDTIFLPSNTISSKL